MDVQKYQAQLEYLHQAVIRLVHITCIVYSHEGSENCTCQCRSISLSRINTIEKYQCFVSKMKCAKHFEKHQDRLVATETIVSWLLLVYRPMAINFIQISVKLLPNDFLHAYSHVSNVLCCDWFHTVTIKLDAGRNPNNAKLAVQDLHSQKLSFWVLFERQFPTHLNCASCLQNTHPAQLYSHPMLMLWLFDKSTLSKLCNQQLIISF